LILFHPFLIEFETMARVIHLSVVLSSSAYEFDL
jgi:hypothetical protein